jgi:hypothetical protein
MLLSDTYRVDLQENRGGAFLLQQPRPPPAISLLQNVAYVFDSNYFFGLLQTAKPMYSESECSGR